MYYLNHPLRNAKINLVPIISLQVILEEYWYEKNLSLVLYDNLAFKIL